MAYDPKADILQASPVITTYSFEVQLNVILHFMCIPF